MILNQTQATLIMRTFCPNGLNYLGVIDAIIEASRIATEYKDKSEIEALLKDNALKSLQKDVKNDVSFLNF